MAPKDLFMLGARLIGIWFFVAALPGMLSGDYFVAVQGIAGLILVTQAERFAQILYPREFTKLERLEKAPRDFRDV